ncbi:UDP-N-acetylglucosamine--LPS N-acetylglucosamine transferase [Thermoanaerobacterium thermosaccharolyticum]|uniref:UDP-N-acetylglucosamine:LPS N-acetylglucosamine transferase n=1 Tax=Thermoanaerobacterium thermosaccharolyticum M0795 TaxID=698948 RepID=L0IG73_THETR|nr:UDP-N-acetylglucosamine--LPS N-acetylglucosamine transferase [Thermoanaerobacterium thermosaccharolyticum]AGB18540.1 UDP-N-acetylglucosamine:LPS N-acetylglucosamine transferase [Thermoanaerobacterium thermosaccharolyticum M0795]
MKSIVFYISDHGFGHASRSLALIENIIHIDKEVKIFIKTGEKQLEFCRAYLSKLNFDDIYYEIKKNDVGLILEKNSLKVDKKKLKYEVENWINNWDYYIYQEEYFYKENKIDLIISDITPQAFIIGKKLGIRTLAISNFTWYEMYVDLLGSISAIEKLYEAYDLADEVFIYPLSEPKNLLFKKYKNIGFVARKSNRWLVQKIREKYLGDLYKRIIFISVGRSVNLEEEIHIKNDDNFYIYTEGLNLKGENTYRLSINTINIQDYIAASDLLITKAGWSSVSEAVVSQVPLLVIDRQEVIEDRTTINKLLELGIADIIDDSTLFNLGNVNFDEFIGRLKKPYFVNPFKNDSYNIAKEILKFIK